MSGGSFYFSNGFLNGTKSDEMNQHEQIKIAFRKNKMKYIYY